MFRRAGLIMSAIRYDAKTPAKPKRGINNKRSASHRATRIHAP